MPFTPDVLSQVGDLWRIESYGPSWGEGMTKIYLTSPEGDRYLVATYEEAVTPTFWDQAAQRVVLTGYGRPVEILDLATSAIVAPYGDPDAVAGATGGTAIFLGQGADGRSLWQASTGDAGTAILAWSGADGWEIAATLPAASGTYGYGADPLSPGGRYYIYQVQSGGQAYWIDLTDPTRTGTIGTYEDGGYCYLETWASATAVVYECGGYGGAPARVSDIATGEDLPYTRPASAVPPSELATIYGSFQLPGTPLVLRTNGWKGDIVSASVLTADGPVEFADLAGFEPFAVGQVDELRPGTYQIHEGDYGPYGMSGDRVIVIDVVAGVVLTPDLAPAPDDYHARPLSSSALVFLEST